MISGVDSRHHNPRAARQPVEDHAPRIHDHGMTVRLASVHVISALRRRDDVGQVLYGARADERIPMRLARGLGESRGHEDQVDVTHGAVELGKAQVIAHRDPEPPVRGIDRADFPAGLDGALLAVALLAHLEAEEVDLVVAGDAHAFLVVDEAGIAHLLGRARFERHRAADDPYAMALRLLREEGLDRALALALARGDLVGVLHAHDREILGERDDARARGGSELDEPPRLLQVRRDIRPRGHLDRRHAEHRLRDRHRLAEGRRRGRVLGDDHGVASLTASRRWWRRTRASWRRSSAVATRGG